MIFSDHGIVVTAGVGLLAVSSLPAASAGKVCEKTESGEEVCRDTFPLAAKIAISVVSVIIIFLTLTLVLCVRRNRKAAAEADKDYIVEASQVSGPPTIVAATYTPETGHSVSRMYIIGTAGSGEGTPADAPKTGPAIPPNAMTQGVDSPVSIVVDPSSGAPRIVIQNVQPQTAPAHKANYSTGSYPFTGYGNSNLGESPSQPRSAFVSSGGFPRPLLSGRLKDRIRERPPSISTVATLRSPST